ncbi:MAG: hypothetical protein ACQEQ7_10905 [Thermodesulfobacteriota bacterium]
MDYRRIDEDKVEILPGELSLEELLEEMARLSYETAISPFPQYIQPMEVPASLVDFRSLITDAGLHMDYLNGRLCSTHVERREDRLIFDAKRFKEDRGSPRAFLNLLREGLKACK